MFAPSETTLVILTFVTSCLATYMLLAMIDKIFETIDIKFKNLEEEKKTLTNELEIIKNEKNQFLIVKSENDELLERNYQLLMTIDHLNTEIHKLQSDEELLEENMKLVKTCEKLHIKCNSYFYEGSVKTPEFDTYKWIKVDSLKNYVHYAQYQNVEKIKNLIY